MVMFVPERVTTPPVVRGRYRRSIALGLAISMIAALPSRGEPETGAHIKSFEAMAKKICPGSRLEYLETDDLYDILHHFREQLPSSVQSRFDKAAQPMCEQDRGGFCPNVAYLRSAEKLGLTSKLTAYACKTGYSCATPSVCSVSALGPGGETYGQSIKPFEIMTGKLCPDSRLEWLSPADFDSILEDFREKLPAKIHARFEKAAQPICLGSRGGLSCSNIAYIRSAAKLGMTSRVAAFACKSGYVCKAQSECEIAKPAGK